MPSKKPTPLSELGEFNLINHLTKDIVKKNPSTVFGIGDDAAIIDSGDKCIVVTTDMLMEGIHFDLVYTPLKHLGYKAVIVNLSDVYAMNAQPRQITVSIALSSKFSVEAIEELYTGIKLACEKYGVDLVGGDTVSSLTGLAISITAIGEALKEDVKYRNSAKVNDLICVSGDLGAAYVGLQILEREKSVYKDNPSLQPELSGYDYILERQLKPEAGKHIIELLHTNEVKIHSMIDISDGLSSEILHICRNSEAGCRLYHEKIPIHPQTIQTAEELNIEPLICALHGGEDYELLFTVPLSEFDKLSAIDGISIIGSITVKEDGTNLVTKDGNEMALTAQGWDGLEFEPRRRA